MKKKILIIITIILIISIYKINKEEITIPSSSIRLRIIPNSNETKDIYIKEKVKKYIEKDIYSLIKDTDDIETSRNKIKSNIPNIETNIDKIFEYYNYDNTYKVNYGNNYFPEKKYKGITYEEGYYESLVVMIGEGSGDNFWCVLFPNFCLIDTKNPKEYKSYIKEIINKIF